MVHVVGHNKELNNLLSSYVLRDDPQRKDGIKRRLTFELGDIFCGWIDSIVDFRRSETTCRDGGYYLDSDSRMD